MLREEIIKVLKSNRSIFIFLYFMVVAIGQNIYTYFLVSSEYSGYSNPHPVTMTLLAGGDSVIFPALFFWLLPIPLILLYCGRYNEEKNKNLTYLYTVKSGRKKYFFSKLTASFILPVIYTGIPLLVNLLISVAMLHGGTSFCGDELEPIEAFTLPGETFSYWCIHHPYTGWVIYFLAAMFIFGMAGVLAQCIAIITKDNRITYVMAFAIWIALFTLKKINTAYIIQPYTEYGSYYGIRSALVILVIVLISVIISAYLLIHKKDII